MKKIFLSAAIIATMLSASCGSKTNENVDKPIEPGNVDVPNDNENNGNQDNNQNVITLEQTKSENVAALRAYYQEELTKAKKTATSDSDSVLNEEITKINNATSIGDCNSKLDVAKTNVLNAINAIVDINALISSAKTEISEYASSKLTLANKTDDGSVKKVVDDSLANLDTLTTKEAIDQAVTTAKANIDSAVEAIKVEENKPVDLTALKQAAISQLQIYGDAELKKSGKTDDGTYSKALSDGEALINSATSEDLINSSLTTAKANVLAAIEAIKVVTPEPEQPTNPSTEALIYGAGLNETIAVEFNETNPSKAKVYYKLASDSSYTLIDSELVRAKSSSVARADILGLKEGTYSVKVVKSDNTEIVTDNLKVYPQDRSGYAHFGHSNAIGAYNNDGTLKANTTVVYVNEANKNTVTATINGKTYTGLANILMNQSSSTTPLCIRVTGKIAAATWNPISYSKGSSNLTVDKIVDKNGNPLPQQSLTEDDIIKGGYNTLNTTTYTKLNGLDNRIKYSSGEFDSMYNMLNVKDAKNITLEGIGTDAEIFQWGFNFKNCSYIEVRNLTFDDYTEDACSFEGSETSVTTLSAYKTGYIWFHNNTINQGINYWDVCPEQDKHEGDGGTDLKGQRNITLSYNNYNNCHKTGLVGGGDAHSTANITFHHNYYNTNGSRLPLGRHANMHMYNNYYYGSTGTNMSLRAGAYAFIENSVFENANNPIECVSGTATDGTKRIGAAKVYNSTFTNCKNKNNGTVVTSRTQTVTNDNLYSTTFDTDSNLFYYDATTKSSKVQLLNATSDVKTITTKYSGVLKENATALTFDGSTAGSTGSGETGGSTTGGTTGGSTESGSTETINWTTVANYDFTDTNVTYNTTQVTNGIYYSTNAVDVNNAIDTTNNYIKNTNGELVVYDNSTSTTYGYIMFDQVNSGKLSISLELKATPSSGKWTPVEFLGEGQNLRIRTDSSKNIGVNFSDSADANIVQGGQTYAAGDTITVELVMDFDTSTCVVTINGKVINVTGNTFTALNGIQFMTAGTATRTFNVDNVVIKTA